MALDKEMMLGGGIYPSSLVMVNPMRNIKIICLITLIVACLSILFRIVSNDTNTITREDNANYLNSLDRLQPIFASGKDELIQMETLTLYQMEATRRRCLSGERTLIFVSAKSFNEIVEYLKELLIQNGFREAPLNPYYPGFLNQEIALIISKEDDLIDSLEFNTLYRILIIYRFPSYMSCF